MKGRYKQAPMLLGTTAYIADKLMHQDQSLWA